MYRIFLVEDDQSIAGAVAKHLDSWGWEVHRVMDFQRVLEEFQAFGPHLVLLDIGLPFRNGYHWCAGYPSSSSPPRRTT